MDIIYTTENRNENHYSERVDVDYWEEEFAAWK